MKRMISILLAFCMVCSCVTAFAATEDSTRMAEALEKVKQKIDVPEEWNQFESSILDDETLFYSFVWRNKNGTGSLRVTADANGAVSAYSVYDSTIVYDQNEINALTLQEAKNTADTFLQKLMPEKYERLQYTDGTNRGSSRYAYTYQHVENGYPVNKEYVNVTVNILDKQAVITNVQTSKWTDTGFTVPTEKIGLEKAREIYRQGGEYELQYLRNYKDNSLYLAYVPKNGTKYIDASTGEMIKPDLYADLYRGMSSGASADAENSAALKDNGFTEEELAELSKIEGLLSTEEVWTNIKQMPEISIDKDSSILSQKLARKEKDSETYYMTLTFGNGKIQNGYVTVDAKTGELICYSKYDEAKADRAEEKQLTEEQKQQFKTAADAFLQKYAPENFSQTRYEEVTNNGTDRAVVRYTRLIQDIPYYNNGITLTYDTVTKKVISMYSTMEDIHKTAQPSEVTISQDDAYTLVFDTAKMVEKYVLVNKKPVLVYTLDNLNAVDVNAVTGKVIRANGTPYTEPFEGYTDISGHWAEQYINRLAERDIIFGTTEFMPDKTITQAEYLSLLYSISYGAENQSIDDVYDSMIRMKVLTKEEKDPNKAVTKEEALVYLFNLEGYGDIAGLPGIFVTGFADEAKIKRIGYVAIAKGMGVVTGNDENEFRPGDAVTRAEAAAILYKYLVK